MIDKKIGIIGCGNMGSALLAHLSTIVDKSTALMVTELDASRRDYIQEKYKIIVAIDNNYLVKYSDVIIIAVKPKDFENVLSQEICCGISSEKLLISVAAGITIKHIESFVGKDVPVIRVMSNMAASVGEAISSISAGRAVKDEDLKLAKHIFSTIGEVVEVDEKLFDAVTAISGSGPAYFFYLAEALVEAAKKLGLKEDVAERLVYKTALGSAKMLNLSEEGPGQLRIKVTSKGGTTEAALKVLKAGKFRQMVRLAAEKAARRAKELSER